MFKDDSRVKVNRPRVEIKWNTKKIQLIKNKAEKYEK